MGLPHYIIPDNSTWNSVHDSTTSPSNILSMLPVRRADIHGNNTQSPSRALLKEVWDMFLGFCGWKTKTTQVAHHLIGRTIGVCWLASSITEISTDNIQ